MADAPKADYKAPTELPLTAQAQKNVGRPKRTPDEQAEYFYNLPRMHLIFFISSLLLLVSLVAMFVDDYSGVLRGNNRDWKIYQGVYNDLELARLQEELRAIGESLKNTDGEIRTIDGQILKLEEDLKADAEVEVKVKVMDPATQTKKDVAERVTLKGLEAKRQELLGPHKLKMDEMNFAKSDYVVVRWHFEEAEHHFEEARKNSDPRVSHFQAHFRHKEEEWRHVQERVNKAKAEFDAVDAERSKIEDQILAVKRPLADAQAARAKILKERDDRRVRLSREKPQLANHLRDAPMLDFFDPRLKVQQKLLPNILEDFNFAKIEKNDRCHTCHRGIDNPGYEVESFPDAKDESRRLVFKDAFLRGFIDHASDHSKKEACEVCKGVAAGVMIERIPHGSWTSEDVVKYTKTLMAHPKLDLYVSGASPHAIDKVGCTTCHEGDGRETEFSRAVHMPDTEKQWKEWEGRHAYTYRELWEAPMLPKRHIYASCRKCHNQEVELPGGDDYVKGMQLYERVGCYACHRTDSYQILPKDTDVDPKKDPNGLAARKLDPNRKYRRPGPPLTHIKDKVGPDWAAKWVLAPKDFRLSTRMPHFFGQSNARTLKIDGKEIPPQQSEPLVVGAMIKYLFEASASHNYPSLPAVAQAAEAKRGEAVFEQVGCRACHTAEPDSTYALNKDLKNDDDWRRSPKGESRYLKEFAPNLAGIASKFADNPDRGAKWLFNWVKNPKHYFAGTRMPDLRLSDQDAADLVAYLMSLRKEGDFEKKPGMPVYGEAEHKIVDELIFEQLRTKMPTVDARTAIDALRKKPEEKLLWFGRRMVQNYGCFSCHEMTPERPNERQKDRSQPDKVVDPMLQRLPLSELPIEWTNIEGIGVELTGAQPEGNKAVDRLAFGYTEYDGVDLAGHGENHHGVAFEHGFFKKPYRHEDPENPKPDTVRVREFRHLWIKNKLFDPRVFDGGRMSSLPPDEMLRMPNFYLNPEEVRLLTTFVLSFTNHDYPAALLNNAKRKLGPDELATIRGHRLIRENNCRSCHRFTLDRLEFEWTRPNPDDPSKLMTTREWAEGLAAGKVPPEDKETLLKMWKLWPENADDQKAAELYTFQWVSNGSTMAMHPAINPSSKFVLVSKGRMQYIDADGATVNGLRPVLKWLPAEGGDIIDHIVAYKKKHVDDWLDKDGDPIVNTDDWTVLFSRLPPMLRSQGVKTQPEWLFDFLKNPKQIRPALGPLPGVWGGPPDMNVRMPTFHFTDEEAASLVRYFWTRDRLAPEESHPYTDFHERGEELLGARKDTITKMGAYTVALQKCGSCHFASGQHPPGGPEFSHKFAPELANVQRRLRPRWLAPWIVDPSVVYPGTTMTKWNFAPDFEQDDGMKAVIEFLMNYDKFKPETKAPTPPK